MTDRNWRRGTFSRSREIVCSETSASSSVSERREGGQFATRKSQVSSSGYVGPWLEITSCLKFDNEPNSLAARGLSMRVNPSSPKMSTLTYKRQSG